MVVALTAGQRHESRPAIPLLERMAHRIWPDALAGDQGDSGSDLRHGLRQRDVEAVIPDRADETGPRPDDRSLDRERSLIERMINRLTRSRRVATRDDTRAVTSLAMVMIAMILALR